MASTEAAPKIVLSEAGLRCVEGDRGVEEGRAVVTARTIVRHECARCGHRSPADRMIFSTPTRLRYCRDFRACDRRLARAERKMRDLLSEGSPASSLPAGEGATDPGAGLPTEPAVFPRTPPATPLMGVVAS